jgi:DNA-binding MarR family transcriptional regulator
MTYPDTPGYQAHSETSREAAEKLSADTLRQAVLDDIALHERQGRTGDELAEHFSTAPGTISARLIELERSGRVIKTAQKRRTTARRQAFVYVAAQFWTAELGRATIKKAQNYDIIRLEAEHGRMKATLEALDGAIMTGSRVELKCAIWKGLGKGEYKEQDPYT